MASYEEAYEALNPGQRTAVDRTDGPVLVIAGPGTGKTQLLTTRIAHILATTDTLPENILCLTFTDAAAVTMRERLNNMIGSAAYSVTISTYHAFGSDILRRYPEFFSEAMDLESADALRIDQIMRDIQARLPYSNGLKHEVFLSDIKSLISDYKRALLTPADVKAIAEANLEFLRAASRQIAEHVGSMPKITKASISAFAALSAAGKSLPETAVATAQPLKTLWQESLEEAVNEAVETGKTGSITAWKNRWLVKDAAGHFTAGGQEAARKQLAAADIYERYLKQLSKLKLYDYDDMILQAIRGLSANDELRYTLQEKYQYLLLDEFQDTNQAQLRLVQLLTDNPVNEGRPNVLAVGDDDQAIYAFQGADYSHMLEFYRHYKDVLVVPLTQNYRSEPGILSLSGRISQQISERLHHNFPSISKELQPQHETDTGLKLERQEFMSDLSQNAWVAQKIKQLIDGGLPAGNIAVLAPKHQYLESLVPFLKQQAVPIRYEKREDVLTDPAISNIITMSRLVLALAERNDEAADSLWPQVLSMPFWKLSTSHIWNASWTAKDTGSWTETVLADEAMRSIGLFFIRLSMTALEEPLETSLDYLSGVSTIDLKEPGVAEYRSPFYTYFFGTAAPGADEQVDFWQLLGNLTVLRQRLRDYRSDGAASPNLADFMAFITAHQAADIKILNTNPYQESDEAVQLMTAYKAKGQEFEAVFVLALNDEVWGSRAKTQASRIAIPENLKYIRYAGASEDERLRLLYVALTRAKAQLYMTNFTTSFSGARLSRLKYLQETSEDERVISPLLPEGHQEVLHSDTTPPTIEDLSVYWHGRHLEGAQNPKLRELLAGRLSNFQLSASQLIRFTDTSVDGPTSFLMRDLLRFPTASSLSGIYGDVIHECLHWLQTMVKTDGKLPDDKMTINRLATIISGKRLSEQDAGLLLQRGSDCLTAYLSQRGDRFQAPDYSEHNFRSEGVFIGEAHLSGKVDRITVDPAAKTATIIDYKTGRSHGRWSKDLTLLRYKQQLYFYKLLVEGSTTFKGYTVTDAYLEFVEPDADGNINELHLSFDEAELADFKALIQVVWQHIKQLDFPVVSGYSPDVTGTLQFQADLIK